jgi:hypothetical protein
MFSIRLSKNLLRNFKGMPYNHGIFNLGSVRHYRQVKDLTEITYTAQAEHYQRSEKYLEYTSKVYKPSRTITFDRNGEVLLFSCDNFRHSQVYLKYPYIMFDFILPLSLYNLIIDPCKLLYKDILFINSSFSFLAS